VEVTIEKDAIVLRRHVAPPIVVSSTEGVDSEKWRSMLKRGVIGGDFRVAGDGG